MGTLFCVGVVAIRIVKDLAEALSSASSSEAVTVPILFANRSFAVERT